MSLRSTTGAVNTKALGVIAVGGAFLAGAALTFFYLQQSTQAEAPAPEPAAATAAAPAIPAVADMSPPPPPPEPVQPEPPAPAEQPAFTLKGVYVHQDSQRAMALIADGSGNEKAYRVGQSLGDGYVLKAVGSKSVEIEKNGAATELPLARGQPSSEPEEPVTAQPSVTPPPPPSAEFMKWWEQNAQVKEPPSPDSPESQTTPPPEPEVETTEAAAP